MKTRRAKKKYSRRSEEVVVCCYRRQCLWRQSIKTLARVMRNPIERFSVANETGTTKPTCQLSWLTRHVAFEDQFTYDKGLT